MTFEKTPAGQRDEPTSANPGRHALSRGQLTALVIGAGAVFVGVSLRNVPPSAAKAEAERTELVTELSYTVPTFKATANQWAALSLAETHEQSFDNARRTEGFIAVDDDLNTPVFSPYTGRVTQVIAKPGELVKAGQPLFTIQASEFVQAQSDLIAAAATLRTATAQLRLAQTTEKRLHDLYEAQGAALKDWQQAGVDVATARGSAAAAASSLDAVHGRLRILGKTDAEITSLEQHPEAATAMPDVQVLAPIAGTVIQRQVGAGQYITSASNGASGPVYTIGNLSKVWLVANVRERDAGLIHAGDQVQVRVLAFPDRVFTARVNYVAPQIDPVTRRLSVRAEIENPDLMLKPQMFSTFTITTGAPRVSLAVPAHGVVREGRTAHVWVANPASRTLEMRQVQTGRTADGLIEITEGLSADERIVTAGAVFIDRGGEND